ncbi:NAD(P)-binding protein [Streptomyces zhihengii]
MSGVPRKETKKTPENQYDVAILGSGMAGGMLGAVLARNGVKVLLLDAGTHPASRWASRRSRTRPA